MNTKLLVLCVSVVVFVGYMAVFFIIQHTREMSGPPRKIPVDTRFKTTTIHYTDAQGREVETEKQFEVRTDFVNPEVMKLLPPPPSAAPVTNVPAVPVSGSTPP
jgi:hypothetical protein